MAALKTRFLLAIMGLSLSIACLNAQPLAQDFKVLSPSSTDTVNSGSLLIVIQLPENHNSKNKDYQLILDGKRDISEFLLVRKNILSVIHSQQLEGGRHAFELFKKVTEKDNPELLLVSYFIVRESAQKPIAQKVTPSPPKKVTKKKPRLTGAINFSTSDAEISGQGAELRQEPATVRQIGGNLKLRVGEGQLVLKGFYTTNSQGDFSYRNTFNIGYIKDEFRVTLGDHFVNYDPYTFTGIRIRGLLFQTPFYKSPTKLMIMLGVNVDIQSAGETFPPPPGEANDLFSSAVPRYQRNYLFFQVRTDYKNKKNYSKISFSASRDIPGDELIPGIAPQDNTTLSYEALIPFAKQRGYVKMYAGLTYTALNNTLGGTRFIIVMNSSMVPLLNFKGLQPFAFALEVGIPVTKANDLIIEGKRIGGAFIPHGNPYLLNNREIIRVTNRTRLFKNRFFLNLSYDYMIDNLTKQRPQTRENSSFSGSMSIRPSQKLPSLTIGYRYLISNTYSIIQDNFNVENTSIFGSLNYILQLNPMTFQFSLARNDMNLISTMMANTRQEVTSLSISASFKNIAGVSFQGANTIQIRDDLDIPQKSFSAQIWYRLKQPNIRLHVRALTTTLEYKDLGEENRQGVQGGLDYSFKRYLTIGASAGYLPFSSYAEDRNYLERFIRIRGSVRF